MKALLLFACLLVLLPACRSIDPGIEGNAGISAMIPCRDFHRIADTLQAILADEGYTVLASENSQTPVYGSSPRFRLSCEFRNGRRIWFIAQPRADGWVLQALPEPDGTDTWFPRRQISRVLEELQSRCAQASRGTGNAVHPAPPAARGKPIAPGARMTLSTP